ncbi:glycerol-3-phosphate dehydrogenase [Luteitalea sp. TBR-22]|uniref:glycerol-3-phosphate dehydrogenase/oxidase n=1 Tax=Luteitalea sp. TBR-22 TaxID=2802971 RepID=UPI001AF17EDC|nr:glycerol-3-phosphate dehydrogenase/oxidase [Luteitalea sp. TBR-22]BCS33271.1 glycerol-3-phosphate dehydrogenase [Luteitalea sp. TBR-22]
MRRDPSRLTTTEFDLLIVGAGIYGATVAWDATQRGLKVALIDRGDFGSGTSFNNAKTVHGGVRSLQRGHLGEMREYLRERRALSHILPHLVHPLPFLMPTSRRLMRHKLALAAYFRLNDLLARDRNDLPDPSKHLPASRVLSRDECLRLAPWIDPHGVTGGIEWHDAQFSNSSRAELAFITSAVRQGLEAANYVQAVGLIRQDSGRVVGVMAQEHLPDPGPPFPIRARAVLLATGGWTADLVRAWGAGTARRVPQWSVAMNLVIEGLGGTHAVGGNARGRLFFLAPWRGATIAGTSHDPWTATAEHLSPRPEYVSQLLADLNVAFPRAGITAAAIRLVHRGLLPASEASATRVTLLRESPFIDHAEDGCPQLYSLVGVRYTTARHSAERAVDTLVRALDASTAPCATATTRLAGGEIDRFDAFLADARRAATPAIPAALIERLVYSYGTAWRDVVSLAEGRPDLLRPLGSVAREGDDAPAPSRAAAPGGPGTDVTGAEILFAVRQEMAVTLGDALLRRTEAGSRGYPGAEATAAATDIMGDELGWSATRRERERQALARTYEAATTRGN